jgi:hypothetical protein
MTDEQYIHIAMLNSFNVVTGKISIEDLLYSGLNMVIHLPSEDIEEEKLLIMIAYFEQEEMYEECIELRKIYDERFSEITIPKPVVKNICDCKKPTIPKYGRSVRCGTCNKQII